MSERGGLPLTVHVSAANRNDHLEFEAVVDSVRPVTVPVGRPRRRPGKLHADKGYDYPTCRTVLRRRGVIARIARRGCLAPGLMETSNTRRIRSHGGTTEVPGRVA